MSYLFGFVFGCYDLSQFLFTPVFAFLADHFGLRITIIISVVLNIVGNIIYSFALYTGTNLTQADQSQSSLGTYQMVIVGRLIAGIGSASLGLGIVYFTRTTSIAERMSAIGYYRISQVSPVVPVNAMCILKL
jgi:MFS family permease